MLKYKKIVLFTIIFMCLFVCSLSTISAANNTINTSSTITDGIAGTGDGDTLTLQEGIYNKTDDYGITISKNITIQGNTSTNQVIIDATKSNRIFTIGNNVNVTFINLTFTNAQTNNDGGAIYNNNLGTTITIINCTFTNNTSNGSSFGGGAVANYGDNMAISGSNFINNTAKKGGAVINYGANMTISGSNFINSTINGSGDNGGAVYNTGDNMAITGSNFTNSTAYQGVGGAVYNAGGANMTISGSNFINSTSLTSMGPGGAVYNTGANMIISGSNFINSITGYYAGAVANMGVNMIISGSNFINSTSGLHGGAVYNFAANMTISGSNFTNNTASNYGGAVYNNGGTINITGSNFINSTSERGGAVCNNAGAINITGSNFTNNSARTNGGGIYNQGNMIVSNNIMNGNTAASGGDMIYNAGNMGILNLTYINNSTKVVRWGQAVTLFATLTDDMGNTVTGQNINFIVNGTNKGSVTAIEGYANISLIITGSAGDLLPVSGNYTGRNGYDINLLNGTLLIKLDTNSTIVVSPNPVSIGENVTVSGQLANYTGVASVNVTVDGTLSNVAVNNGYWELNYTTNRTDTDLEVIVSFAGDGNYYAFSNSTIFTVNKSSTNSTVVVSPNPVSIGENVTVSGQLANYTGVASVNVTVDGNIRLVNVTRTGGWSLNYATNRTGSINVTVSLSGNGNFFDFSNSTTFNVAMTSTNSTIVVGNVQIGENATISGVLANFTGVTQVNVTVDGNIQLVNVDGTGGWSLNYATNRTGSINVTVSLSGNGNFFDFSNSTTFTVNKNSTNSTIVVNPNPAQISENITISGQLANFTGVTSVNVTVDGTIFTNVTVDVSGYWELNYTTNRTGTFDIVVSFAGNENYTSFTNTISFNVTKIAANSTINIPKTVKVGKTITIEGILVDENGNPVANAPINVTVGGKVYSLATDFNGRWILTYKPTHTGIVDAVLDYAGNDKYFSYTNTTTFNVVKGQVIVDIDVVKNSDGSVDVIVTVTDEYGDPIPDYKVNIVLDGKNIGNIVTNVLGIGRIHIPNNKLSVGRHVITVSSDNANYNVNPVSAEFETQNNNKNDTNNTNKTSDNPVATATMKNTGIPIIAIILVLITIFGISIRRKQN
ncbi:bacterial Ig-like domain protein [Methanobrevibacter cuticularis]|uniref:Bacterial Ig-like domain protein n=1 Tax=Methanobrevibacter cuticularis TaxID=47311 RepID=A0A166EX48_9EURY|nr:hypothetical protein [Methanobrevibacter cuticularis]KZX17108.1 bacterial Ig-like domain protein [Methanobrevibacter cuticularis]